MDDIESWSSCGAAVPTMDDFMRLVAINNYNVEGISKALTEVLARITALEERLRVTQSYVQELRHSQ